MNASSIAVIRARLPYVDRRALSEAWFSALHLAQAERPTARRAGPAVARERFGGSAVKRPAACGAAQNPAQRPPSLDVRPLRGLRTEGAQPQLRRLGGAVVAPFPTRGIRYAPVRASFYIGIGGGRVQIVLRRDGEILHVVALCSRRHVELVRRALACADFHLRMRGETIRSSVRALEACRA